MLTPETQALATLLKKRIARASKHCVSGGIVTQDTGYFVAKEIVVIAEALAASMGPAGPEFLEAVGTEATPKQDASAECRITTWIDRPGQYQTRKGELVRIVSGRTQESGAHVWSGWIARTATNGTIRKQWSDWPSNGLFGAAPAFDVVAYVGA